MPCRTMKLTQAAEDYLRMKVKGRVGIGAVVSEALAAMRATEEARLAAKALREQELSTAQSWEQSGCRVD